MSVAGAGVRFLTPRALPVSRRVRAMTLRLSRVVRSRRLPPGSVAR
ncbi:Hypothetical protein A7982_08040 [Minicystis rosea]|nr:Hypothetical protein A7982_08040 [Minicystis rosea]